MINKDYFKNIKNEEKAYLLGFFYADACISGNRLFLEISNRDLDLLYKISSIFDVPVRDTSRVDKRTNKFYKQSKISLNCKSLVEDLKSIGIGARKTYDSQFVVFENIDYNLIPFFIRGLIDGDGHVDSKFNRLYISSNHYCLLEVLNYLKSKHKITSGSLYENDNYSTLSICGIKNLNKIFKIIYEERSIFLERKFFEFEKIKNKNIFSSRFKGVSMHHASGKWRARKNINGKEIFIGYFDTEEEAANAFINYINKI